MPENIQRNPGGLLNVLGIQSGGVAPRQLADQLNGTIDFLQCYARSMSVTPFATNAAAALGTAVALTVPENTWWILQLAAGTITEDVNMTALAMTVSVNGVVVAYQENFNIANALPQAGANFACPWTAPYPLLLPPGTVVNARVVKLGGVASCSITVNALVGILQ